VAALPDLRVWLERRASPVHRVPVVPSGRRDHLELLEHQELPDHRAQLEYLERQDPADQPV